VARKQRHADSLNDILALLETTRAECGQRGCIVRIWSPAGTRLDIGVGAAASFLQFIRSDEDSYLITVGDRLLEGVEAFYLDGHHMEIPRRNLIAREDARKAVAVFFETSAMPTNVTWEEV